MSTNGSRNDYINIVCAQIKCQEVHKDIKIELESHLDDIVEECVSNGLSKEEANLTAMKRLGDPLILGKQLHQTHKPLTEWSVIGSLAILLLLGVLVMASIGMGHSLQILNTKDLVVSKAISIIIGFVLIVGMYFLDYRIIRNYSSWLLGITLSLMVAQLFGVKINGMSMLGGIHSNTNFLPDTPILLLVAVSAQFTRWDWNRKFALRKAWLLLIAPMILYIKGHAGLSTEVEYLIGFIVLMVSAKAKKSQVIYMILGSCSAILALFLVGIYNHNDIIDRLTIWLNSYNNPAGMGLQLIRSITAIREAGLWGHGFGSSLQMLPAVHTDFVFTYFVYSFGWVAGVILIALVLFLIFRMLKMAEKIREPFGAFTVKVVCVYFTIQFFWSILMCLNYAPVDDVSLPFVSYGNVQLIAQMFSIGLLLSIYRRKNMINVTV